MATGRSRGPASRPPRRPGGGRPRASTRATASAPAPTVVKGSGWRGRLTTAAKDRRTRRGAVLLSIVAFLMVLLGSTVAAYVSQRGDIAALQDKVASQQHDVAALQAEQEQLARPGLRRAAGPAAAEVRQAGGAVLHRARRRTVHRHGRPGARGGRTRRAAALVRDGVAVHPNRRRPRGAPVTARADLPPVAQADLDAVSRQLGRQARGVAEVAHRCPCGEPDVVRTEPRLPDGTPFPTSFYATCPRLTGALSTLESQGVMREMNDRLEADPVLREAVCRRTPRLPRAPLPAR